MTERRTALVTGTAGGIGRAIALALQSEGMDVVSVDRIPQSSDLIARPVVVDLADPAACEELVHSIGRVDILVNNASILILKSLEELTLEDFRSSFDINMRAPVLLTRAVLPAMSQQGWGRIINLSSVGARTGGISQSAVYNMTKAGIGSFSRFVARHYGALGITCNAIAPGAIETGMTLHMTEAERSSLISQIPTGRMAQPSEVAAAAVYLSSDSAAHVNGVTLDINGGWVMA